MSVEFIRISREFYAIEAIDFLFSHFALKHKPTSMMQGYFPFTEDGEFDMGKSVYSRYQIVTTRAVEKLLYDFITYREAFITMLDQAFRDYLIVAMAGEARNARSKADRFSPSIPYIESRSSCMKNILQFSKESLIETFEELYNPEITRWQGSFGGKAWHSGVKALQIVDRISFVDHCIDLQHNCGSMFNKSDYGLFRVSSGGQLTEYLDFKRYASAEQILENYTEIWTNVSAYLYNILTRACNLGIINGEYDIYNGNSEQTHTVNTVLNYEPLNFGYARLIGTIYSDDNFELDDYADDSEEQQPFSFTVWIRSNQ